jgi:hypothetical protein
MAQSRTTQSAPTRILWRQALQASLGQASTGYGHRLQQALGSWYPDRDSNWFYSPSDQLLFPQTTTYWLSFCTSSSRPSRHQSRRHFYPKSSIKDLPSDAVPTIVHAIHRSSAVVSTGIRESSTTRSTETLPTSTSIPLRSLAGRLAGCR